MQKGLILKKYKNLFGKRQDGKYQIWWMEQNGNMTRAVSGIYDETALVPVQTSIVQSTWTTVEGTNLGRANERTPEEQAEFEILRNYRMKMETGYVENIGDVPMFENRIEVMLANKFDEEKDYTGWYSQPKLDGCVSGDGYVETENGKRKVSDVYSGDDKLILSYNVKMQKCEFANITGKFKNSANTVKHKKWLCITLNDGSKIVVTDTHRVFLPELQCWRESFQLKIGDKVLSV